VPRLGPVASFIFATPPNFLSVTASAPPAAANASRADPLGSKQTLKSMRYVFDHGLDLVPGYVTAAAAGRWRFVEAATVP
jgi:hypothetical protein